MFGVHSMQPSPNYFGLLFSIRISKNHSLRHPYPLPFHWEVSPLNPARGWGELDGAEPRLKMQFCTNINKVGRNCMEIIMLCCYWFYHYSMKAFKLYSFAFYFKFTVTAQYMANFWVPWHRTRMHCTPSTPYCYATVHASFCKVKSLIAILLLRIFCIYVITLI